MSNLKCIFLKGWVKTSNMNKNDWFDTWFNDVLKEEQNGNEIVVFKIPKKMSSDLITKIETLIQKHLDIKSN